jgi:prepilin-type N-terminal cleavage/methylation domain-containing protein
MTPEMAARRKRQAGFTLIELIIASTIGVLVMGALGSVVVTSMIAVNTANARVETSTQVRNFQFSAADDVALARAPAPTGCGTPVTPCTTQDLVLQGSRVPNQDMGVAAPYTIRYAWDPNRKLVTRYAGTSSRVTSTNVTAYSWYIERGGSVPSVVVSMTVTVAAYDTVYSESQTFRFNAEVTSSP